MSVARIFDLSSPLSPIEFWDLILYALDMRDFEMRHIVTADEIDAFGHVNNMVYLKWFNMVASKHCEAVDYSGKLMWENGFGWIIKSHRIEYLIAIKPYENIVIKTRVESVRAASSVRSYSVVNEKGEISTKGETVWVWVNYKTGRPCRIPQEVLFKFGF